MLPGNASRALIADDPDVPRGGLRRRSRSGSGRHGVHEVGIDIAQNVIAASREQTRDRDRRDLAAMTVFESRVVGVVGTALMGRVLRGFVQRPPQRLGTLACQVST